MAEMADILIYIILFIAGLIVGSFLNVVIYRIPRGLSIYKPTFSICPRCKARIAFYDNIPLISYLVLKGRCRSCGAKIPYIYPLVELATALLFLLVFYFFGITIQLLIGLILVSALIAISVIDIQFRIIPNSITWPMTLVGIALNIIDRPSQWWMPLAFSVGAFVFMLIIHLIYPKGMGMGDVKLALMVGAFLVKSVIVALFAGFLIGSIYGLVLIATRKKKFKQAIPFGPFISLGSIIALFWGNIIINWYLGYF
ncbi:MAG: prepilin peptidase [Actinomycetia bacterium]|nr:prepilin peptidase [Actinomycetes bacterium]